MKAAAARAVEALRADAQARAGDAAAEIAVRPVHAVLFALVAGLLAGPRVPWELLGLAAVAGAAAPLRAPTPRAPAVASPSRLLPVVAGLAVLAGAGLSVARTAALERTHLGPELGRSVVGRVVLQEAPRRSRFGGWSARATYRDEPVLVRVGESSSGPLPDPGTILTVRGRLQAPGPFARIRHAHAEVRAASVETVGRRGGLLGMVDGVRRRAELALDRGLPPTSAGLLRGMVLGEDSALPDDARDAFRAAGLSHLVAASGTNVVLLAALALAVGTAAGLDLSGRLWLVLGLLALYVPLAGGGASIQRAGIMGAAAVAAGLAGRPASRWYAVGLAAAVTLGLDPRAAEDPGWQLSFAAVVSLLLVAPRWKASLLRTGMPAPLADVLAMTAAATIVTAPVVAARFGQASLVAIPANLLAAPAVAPVMWLGVVAGTLGQLLALGGPVASLTGALVDGLDALAGFPVAYLAWVGTTAARVPGAMVSAGPWLVGAVCLAGVGVATSRHVRRSAPLVLLLGTLAWLVVVPPGPAPAGPPAGFRLTFLDVGQGDATLVQDRGRSVLVDTGLPDAGIVGLLHHAGVARLDLLVVTHADADHIGGAASVLAALPVGAVLDGRDGVAAPDADAMAATARRRGVELIPGHAGQDLQLGGLDLRVLWPRVEPVALHAGANPNARAIVLEVSAPGARVLLGADAESDVLTRLPLEAVDIMKVSHHGSADPGLPSVLARTRPRIAGIEVGAHNTYGHPAPATLAALRGVPVVVRTDRDGSVRLDRGPGGWEVRAHA